MAYSAIGLIASRKHRRISDAPRRLGSMIWVNQEGSPVRKWAWRSTSEPCREATAAMASLTRRKLARASRGRSRRSCGRRHPGSGRRRFRGRAGGWEARERIPRAAGAKPSMPSPAIAHQPAQEVVAADGDQGDGRARTADPRTWTERSAIRGPVHGPMLEAKRTRVESSRPRNSGKSRSSFLIRSAAGVIPCGL